VLDSEKIPVGIVTGIPAAGGCARRGWWANTTTPAARRGNTGAMPRRRWRNSRIAMDENGAGWRRWPLPGLHLLHDGDDRGAGFTKIAGEATFQLDVRSVSPHCLRLMFEKLHSLWKKSRLGAA